jgi:threonine/homoserine/homoserine lactone efflux protein
LSSLWLADLLVTLSNPKAVLFYLNFLPIIVGITSLLLKDIGVMNLIICISIGSIIFFHVVVVVKAKNKMQPLSDNRIVQRVAGSMIRATGLILLTRGYF